ncbi:MAG: PD-(D/E)XK nuclease family transposase [Butyrivibrio sp.]|nr:PD-(D/E)XK nuclease family transposase [Butyrivibrio sp.]
MKETQSDTNSCKISYQNATGPIEFPLTSDIVFHYTMQKSEKALLGLVCSLKGIKQNEVKKIQVLNPISLNKLSKETILDLLLTLNNNETMNIEVQVYLDKYWKMRSILYLCRAFDCLKGGDDYSLLKPTIHYCITDQEILPDSDEFYSQFLMLNKKNHTAYTDKFGINVLQLNHTELATEKDISNNLLYWAKLFKAKTWEEFKALAKDNPVIEEVGNMIFELNTDEETKYMLEGQRRYKEMIASQYAAGYSDAEDKLNPIIEAQKEELEKVKEDIAKKDLELQKYIDKFGKL